jgi:hypothetical protein
MRKPWLRLKRRMLEPNNLTYANGRLPEFAQTDHGRQPARRQRAAFLQPSSTMRAETDRAKLIEFMRRLGDVRAMRERGLIEPPPASAEEPGNPGALTRRPIGLPPPAPGSDCSFSALLISAFPTNPCPSVSIRG